MSGNAKARQESGHGTGHLRGALIQEAGDEELDDGFPYKCHVSTIELIDISVLSNRKPKTENRKLALTHAISSCRSFITKSRVGGRGRRFGPGVERFLKLVAQAFQPVQV
jgi:hypothetical protein